MRKIKLTPRLAAIASFVEQGSCAADIGTDHGYIPVFLRQNNICPFVIASDINSGPIGSAIKAAEEYGVENIKFVLAPGLDGITPCEADTIIIAGMGGETITEILKGADWLCEGRHRLVLQPQSKTDVLEKYLRDSGFTVSDAKLVKDSGRIYIVLAAETGEYEKQDIFFTAKLIENRDPLLYEYAEGIKRRLSQKRAGVEASAEHNTEELLRITEIIEKLEVLQRECELWRQ